MCVCVCASVVNVEDIGGRSQNGWRKDKGKEEERDIFTPKVSWIMK